MVTQEEANSHGNSNSHDVSAEDSANNNINNNNPDPGNDPALDRNDNNNNSVSSSTNNNGNNDNNNAGEVFVVPDYSRPQIFVLPYQPMTSSPYLSLPTSILNAQRPPRYCPDPPPDYTSATAWRNENASCNWCSMQETYLPNAYLESLQHNERMNIPLSCSRCCTSQRNHRPSTLHDGGRDINMDEDEDRESMSYDGNEVSVRPSEVLTIKKWVMIMLVVCFLLTVSLLVGITLQHFQLLKRLNVEQRQSTMDAEASPNTTASTTEEPTEWSNTILRLNPMFH